jgi:2-oxoglutarate dehydrogenase E1 component
VYNSLLAEASVLGFEYGYSMVAPTGLTIWEAQFGDFVNNAQSIIDLFVASGQSKWQRLSGVVLLLPHGWEGLGPEHSSARLERFLQLCAHDNMIVCNVTTPAQYFHMLRRQCHAVYRKPLIVMTPKSLLRHPLAISDLSEFTNGSLIPVLDDPDKPAASRRVLFCSGKIYYQLYQRRRQINATDMALVRLEQLYPFPEEQVREIIAGYKNAESWAWVQEEPQNMGAWQFVKNRLEALIDNPLKYVGRKPASSPATGFPHIYKMEQSAISDQAIGPLTGKGEAG